MEVPDILQLQVALLNFAVQCYPGRIDYLNHVLGFSAKLLEETVGAGNKVAATSERYVSQLLSTPLEAASIEVLQLNNIPTLMAFLSFDARKAVAVKLLRAVMAAGTAIDSPNMLDQLFTFIAPLMRDDDDAPPADGGDGEGGSGSGSSSADAREEFEEEQVRAAGAPDCAPYMGWR